MRHAIIALLSATALVACGDDAANPGGDATENDTFVPLDTNPDKDTPGDTSGGNHPPELERIGDRSVAVAQSLTITLSGKDADGDALTYSVFGNLPEGARFDKTEHRFEWAPTEANKTIFLTFVVSDGTDFDRETVRIQVTATATANPPSFADVGDQTVAAGQPYELKLVATDPDGDKLTYGHEGTLPAGAALDATAGVFTWTPGANLAGAPIRITFTVTDGTASDTLNVSFVVDDGSQPVPKPPTFTAIGPQDATVGQTLTLNLQASDPDGETVTFTMQHEPPGASLNGATFTFTPTQAQAGQTFQVGFTATDGTYSAVMTVQISVKSGQTAQCTADANEPNEDVASATPQGAGNRQATLCETETTFDVDYYKVSIPAGQEIRVKITFDGNLGDLDLVLADASDTTLASSEGVTAVEELTYTAATAMDAFIVVYGFNFEPLAVTYTLEIALSESAVCADDSYEPNDTAFDAKPLDDAAQAATNQICAADEDFWTLQVGCGARVEVVMDITGGVDLDLYLFDTIDALGEPVASAITEDATEALDVHAERPGTWVLLVNGYPAATAEGAYQVIADVTGACQDDAQGGSSRAAAKALANDGAPLAGLTVCCSDDWFSYSLAAGDQVVIDLGVLGEGSLGATVFASDGTTQVASKDPSPNGGLLFFTATTAGTYYVKMSGTVGTSYGFEWTVEAASGSGCTDLSCAKYDVCDSSNGQCVTDYCEADQECPSGYVCRETYCVNPCQSDATCRPGYACKGFDDAVVTSYCGITGPGASGAGCDAHAACEGSLACLFDDRGGYCAGLNCAACGAGTVCKTVGALSFCAQSCSSPADCREADGFTCSENACLPQNP